MYKIFIESQNEINWKQWEIENIPPEYRHDAFFGDGETTVQTEGDNDDDNKYTEYASHDYYYSDNDDEEDKLKKSLSEIKVEKKEKKVLVIKWKEKTYELSEKIYIDDYKFDAVKTLEMYENVFVDGKEIDKYKLDPVLFYKSYRNDPNWFYLIKLSVGLFASVATEAMVERMFKTNKKLLTATKNKTDKSMAEAMNRVGQILKMDTHDMNKWKDEHEYTFGYEYVRIGDIALPEKSPSIKPAKKTSTTKQTKISQKRTYDEMTKDDEKKDNDKNDDDDQYGSEPPKKKPKK